MHGSNFGKYSMIAGATILIYTIYQWWKDVVKEGAIDKAHTNPVRHGLRIGMSFFILSEVMFFFGFFFAFFHASIFPVDVLSGEWSLKAGVWPPENIRTLDAWSLPFLNTLILLLSGTSVTWAHYSLLNKNQKDLARALGVTVLLGLTFTGLQAYEYYHALEHNFGFKDGIYASNFYMATGFHGFHVIIGTIFLAVCYFRAKKGHFSEKHHLGFEFAAWYWHFVDVVWLFLFSFIYIWGA
jgi:cytochrome c oxidase subunit 3